MFASKGHGLLEDPLFCIALGHGSLNQLLDRLHNFQNQTFFLFENNYIWEFKFSRKIKNYLFENFINFCLNLNFYISNNWQFINQTNFDRLFQLWLRVNKVGELIIQKEQR